MRSKKEMRNRIGYNKYFRNIIAENFTKLVKHQTTESRSAKETQIG